MQIICKTTLALVPVLAHTTSLHSHQTKPIDGCLDFYITHTHTHTRMLGAGVDDIW